MDTMWTRGGSACDIPTYVCGIHTCVYDILVSLVYACVCARVAFSQVQIAYSHMCVAHMQVCVAHINVCVAHLHVCETYMWRWCPFLLTTPVKNVLCCAFVWHTYMWMWHTRGAGDITFSGLLKTGVQFCCVCVCVCVCVCGIHTFGLSVATQSSCIHTQHSV